MAHQNLVCHDVCAGDAEAFFAEPLKRLADDFQRGALGSKVYLVRNDGNYGDALIRLGTERFFEDLGIRVAKVDTHPLTPLNKIRMKIGGLRSFLPTPLGANLAFSGGGEWFGPYKNADWYTRMAAGRAGKLVIMPSTFAKPYDRLHNASYWVRDRYESLEAMPFASFCHDMALYLTLVEPDRLLPNRTPPTRGTFHCFRIDHETRFAGALPTDNYDISRDGSDMDDVTPFLRHIDQYESVITDRLHVSIAAALLGKEVKVVGNAYFKIRAIFDSSMAGVFPKCEMVSDEQAAELIRVAS